MDIDDATRAKMAILDLSVAEICAAIERIPMPTDWRNIDGDETMEAKRGLTAIADAALARGRMAHSWIVHTDTAAYNYKCTIRQVEDTHFDVMSDINLQERLSQKLFETFGDRPHNPETLELIFDEHEITQP